MSHCCVYLGSSTQKLTGKQTKSTPIGDIQQGCMAFTQIKARFYSGNIVTCYIKIKEKKFSMS